MVMNFFLYFYHINANIWLLYCIIVLQDVTIGGNWVNGIQDLSVLFLTCACQSTITSK